MNNTSLYLYTTAGCHLCELAETLLQEVMGMLYARVQQVEISDSDDLVASYGLRIPVLAGASHSGDWCELCWPFDASDIQAFMLQLQR